MGAVPSTIPPAADGAADPASNASELAAMAAALSTELSMTDASATNIAELDIFEREIADGSSCAVSPSSDSTIAAPSSVSEQDSTIAVPYTTSATPGDAANAVFNTSELVEMVVEYLPIYDIARLRGLNKSTRTNTDRPGPQLRKLLLQEAEDKEYPERWAYNFDQNSAMSRVGPMDTLKRWQEELIPVVFNQHVIGLDQIPVNHPRSYAQDISRARGMGFRVLVPVNLEPGDLRMNMLISDPPLRLVCADVHVYEDGAMSLYLPAEGGGIRLKAILRKINPVIRSGQEHCSITIQVMMGMGGDYVDFLPISVEEKGIIEANMVQV